MSIDDIIVRTERKGMARGIHRKVPDIHLNDLYYLFLVHVHVKVINLCMLLIFLLPDKVYEYSQYFLERNLRELGCYRYENSRNFNI